MAANFSALQARVQGIIIDLPTTVLGQIPTLINEAVRKLQTRHDFKVCEATTDVFVTSTGTRLLGAVPANWMKARGKPHLITKQGWVREIGYTESLAAVEREFGSTAGGEQTSTEIDGPPRAILRTEASDESGSSLFHVYPLPDGRSLYANGQYRIRVPYFRFLTELTTGSQSNWLTDNATEWVVYQAASDAFLYNWDEERGALWAQRAANSLADVISRDKKERLGSISTLFVSPNVNAQRVTRGDYDGR